MWHDVCVEERRGCRVYVGDICTYVPQATLLSCLHFCCTGFPALFLLSRTRLCPSCLVNCDPLSFQVAICRSYCNPIKLGCLASKLHQILRNINQHVKKRISISLFKKSSRLRQILLLRQIINVIRKDPKITVEYYNCFYIIFYILFHTLFSVFTVIRLFCNFSYFLATVYYFTLIFFLDFYFHTHCLL